VSVVHVKNRSTRDEKCFQDNSSSDRSLLWLSDAAKLESFSIEITVGQEWSERYGPTSNEMHKILDTGMQIGKHGSVVVTSAEEIRVPHNMYGVLVPTGSLFLDKGVLIAPAKVEPAFNGNLKLRLFNTTGLKHVLKKGDKLGSVIFFSTETTEFHTPTTKRSVLVSKRPPWNERLSLWFRTHGSKIFSWTGGSVAAALLVHFVLVPYFPVSGKGASAVSAVSAASAASASVQKSTP
jgi:dUTPase